MLFGTSGDTLVDGAEQRGTAVTAASSEAIDAMERHRAVDARFAAASAAMAGLAGRLQQFPP
jgi:hypothetical protein